jgi:hypothetical protein
MSVLNKLTEGIVNRDLKKEGDALLSKWEKTGLLEGLAGDSTRNGMARLLENQAKQLLREASSMAAGDVEGFASVAFPLVRRVFGGLLANDLVSVQPMSLPSGLIFFLDFTYQEGRAGIDENASLYGGGVVASQITGGVSDITEDAGGFYNLANAYSSPTGSLPLTESAQTAIASLESGKAGDELVDAGAFTTAGGVTISSLTAGQKAQIRYDPDILAKSAGTVSHLVVRLSKAQMDTINLNALPMCELLETDGGALMGISTAKIARRLTHSGYYDSAGTTIVADSKALYLSFYVVSDADSATHELDTSAPILTFPLVDAFTAGTGLGSVVGTDTWGLEEPSPGTGNRGTGADAEKDTIPEIDIKVDSIAVTAITKKLKAKWSPELGQDLNAYHNLDAEVELTSILSEQIALEIDREILNDLVQGATAGTYYWSRSPGLFVSRTTGAEIGASSAAPDFTGTVSEWYETLIETINDVSAQIHRKTLRGGANFLVTSPEVANILEFTAGFRASVTADADRGTVGAVKTGSISKKWDVYVDPYFPRNLVLVGRKGGSFLESGYVYAPYVPLQVTPTIFGTEDFVPRKGVMTRYAKKMVRPDMYGLVIVRGLLGEAGATS